MSTKEPQNPPALAHSETSGDNLPKTYDPAAIEQRWADYWLAERLFDVPPQATNPGAAFKAQSGMSGMDAFTVLLPPPNVTGRLHMGHMLNQTEIDILIRWRRMRGETALWVPGTDHAGIATQMMVERQLAAEGTSRQQLGRDAFTARVWAWKQQYGSAIAAQMKRLGASVDWSREYFTMDDSLSIAVKEAFVRLYRQGLIYRGAYIVNWDPVQQTAVSDLEVSHEERTGKLYHIRYPFADGTGSIVVATTRPETMLGDVAVAVNPADPRYQEHIGKLLTLPLSAAAGKADREIPILADEWANPEFGTGAVKVTPAHDPNDFAIGKRHSLPQLVVMDESAHIRLAGSPYHGLDRYAARDRIVADLESAGLLVAVTDHPLAVAVSQRSGAVIEPRLSMQWFLAVNKPPAAAASAAPGRDSETSAPAHRSSIAQNAIDAVRLGHIRFTPEMYEKTYMEWMNNIHDWCISRQLWWGHRIPAWHCAACNAITVACDTPADCGACGGAHIEQSTDVLDTWFSSGLLPFTVFGWPNAAPDGAPSLTPDLAAFYPTSLLVTGFDILFFWVARMIMLGCHFMLDVPMPDGSPRSLAEAVPFREVYIHALVRDANREKMSKTKGNVVDPIEIITRYGTDAVRFTLASQASPGTDIAFSEPRTEGYRAFANKIWNAARFLFMNLARARQAGIPFHLPPQSVILSEAPAAAQSKDPETPRPDTSAHPLSAPVSDLDPTAFDHSIVGRIATLIAASTPSGEAALQTGNIDSANPSVHAPSLTVAAEPNPESPLESRWILARLSSTTAAVNASLASYRFDEAASHVYQFFWGDLCDWYLEIVKLRLTFEPAPPVILSAAPQGLESKHPDELSPAPAASHLSPTDLPTHAEASAALTTLVHVFESALRLLSPFMPFLTEEIWHALYAGAPPAKSIALTRFPQPQDYPADPEALPRMAAAQDLITAVRAMRKELGVPEKQPVPIRISTRSQNLGSLGEAEPFIARLARVSNIEYVTHPLTGPGTRSTKDYDVAVLYERQIDVAAERERLGKDMAKYEKALAAAERQLGNESFMSRAPAHIVEGLRAQSAETRALYEKTRAALDALPPQ